MVANRLSSRLFTIAAAFVGFVFPVVAHAALTVTPITWNIVGLDSNSPATGPNRFPVGARVCTDLNPTTLTSVSFNWTSTNAFIDLRPGSLSTIPGAQIPALPANGCYDAYFEVEIQQNAAAFDTTRRYTITATDGTGTYSSPTPREVYVEHLISQSRNSVSDVKYGPVGGPLVSVAPGGALNLVVGNTYDIALVGGTATQGYNQFEAFINFPNTIFQITAVDTDYAANNSPYVSTTNHTKLYADACRWENDPNSPMYRACYEDWKSGGAPVTTTYTVKILSGGGTSQTLNTLLYDFSGSSYHYNADYSVGGRIANIIDPNAVTFTKAFAPDPTSTSGVSVLTFTISNPNAGAISGISFSDTFPTSPGAMKVASTPGATTSGCGTPTLTAVANAGSISFTNGTVAANSSCTIKVNVNAPVAGTYNNTSGPLTIGTLITTKVATASVTANNAPPPPAPVCGVTGATWTVPTGATNPPDTAGGFPTIRGSNVSATNTKIFANVTANTGIRTTGGQGDSFSWTTWGYKNAGQYVEIWIDTTNYSAVNLSFYLANPSAGNGPSAIAVTVATDNGAFAQPADVPSRTVAPGGSAFALKTLNLNAETPVFAGASRITKIRLTPTGANNDNPSASLDFDQISFSGCTTPLPPTITKSFTPATVGVGNTSTLAFVITNPLLLSATGVAFNDTLPAGVTVANSSTPVCGGTLTTTAPSTISFSGGSLTAGGNCTVSTPVTVATAGPHDNVSGFVSSTTGGTNSSSTGVATATVTALQAASISKQFGAPIIAGGSTTLTFTITNPNLNDPISSVAFNDTFPVAPGAMKVAPTPGASTSGCGAPTFAPVAGAGSISFSGGSIAAGGTCTVVVNVTAPTAGTYNNTSGTVSHVVNATTVVGNTASASLTVNAATPSLAIVKEVGPTATGPWGPFLPRAVGQNVFYRVTVENTGNVALSGVNINDPQVASWSCTQSGVAASLPASLPVASPSNDNHIVVCVSSSATLAVAGTHTNTATASSTTPGTTSKQDSATYATTSLSLTKSATETYFQVAGDVVHYNYLVTNNGSAPLTAPPTPPNATITVTDDKTTVACPAISTVGDFDNFLDPGESITCTATYTIQAADVAANGVTNNASASAKDTQATPATVTSNLSSVTLPRRAADLSITKTNGVSSVVSGSATTYTITVSNGGPTTVTGATLQDPFVTGLSKTAVVCSPTPGQCSSAPGVAALEAGVALPALAAGQTYQIRVTATVTASSGNVTNTATIATAGGIFEPDPTNNTASDADSVTTSADLSITKTDGSGTYIPGAAISYTITVTNNGPSPVTSVTVTDSVPAAILSPVFTPSSGTYNSGTGAWTGLSLASGQSATLTLSGTVSGSATGNLVNTATVVPPAGTTDPNPGNDSATDTDTPAPQADLAVTKTDGSATYTAGSPITYTITVTNNGPSNVTSLTLTDAVPAAILSPNFTPSAGSYNSGTGAWTGLNLASGQSASLTLSGTVSGSATGNLVNTATVAPPAGTTDPNGGNDSSTDTDTPNPQADLSITKTDGSTTYTPGAAISYTITVTNNGPSTVTSVTVTDTVPAAISSPVFTPSAGSYNSGTGAWTGLNLANGQSVTLTLSGTVSAGATGNLVNTATVAPPAGTTDPNGGNNSATDTDTAAASADLAITKTDGSTTYTPGTPISYTITVTNNGPSTVTSVTVTDTVPAAILSPVFTPSAGSYNSGTGAWTGLSLASGQSVTLTLSGTVSGSATGNLVNTATVAPPAGTTDPNGGNDSATDTDTPAPQADLAITKSDGALTYTPGTPISYTITVTNNGPSTVTSVTVTDAVPAAILSPNFTPSAGSYNSGTGAWTGLNLASGQSATLTLSGTVSGSATGNLVNTATVAPPAGTTDPNNANDSATDSDTADPKADLAITKTDGSATYTPGGAISYTITVTNNGPSTVTSMTVTDTVPAAITSPNFTPSAGSYNSGTGAWTGLNLASGQSVTLTLTGTVDAAATGNLVNSVTVAPPAGTTDPNGGNDTASDSDTASASADLAITKTDGSTTYTPGAAISYTITVTNNGPSTVTSMTVTDTVPAAILTPNFTPSAGSYNSGTGAWTGLNLASGQSVTLTLSGTVSGSATGNLVNTATVAPPAGTTDPNGANDSATDTDTLAASADLSITKTDGATTYTPGTAISYTITVTNNGPSTVTSMTVTDTVPAAITSPVFTPSAGSYNSGTGAWTGLNLASGQSVTLTLSGTVSSSATGNLVNTATVAPPAGTTDPNGGNDSSTDTDTPAPQADLAITKTDGATTYTPGAAISYTITVTNNGPSTVTSVTVTDTVPAAILSPIFTPSAGSYNSGTGAWTGLNLASGQSVTLTLSGTVSGSATGNLVNTATVAPPAGTTDPNGGNDSSTDTDTPDPQADLAITKTDSSATYSAGAPISYTITVTNNGPSTVTSLTVTDTVPAAITSPNFTPSAGSYNSGTGAWTGLNLASGQSVTLTLSGTVSAAATGNLVNTATVAPPAGTTDPNSGNDSSTDTDTPVSKVDLAISKSDGGASVAPGGTVSYTLTYSNGGNVPAGGVTITETVPANTTFNAGASTAGWSCAPNNNAGSTCTISIGSVAAGAGGSVSFAVAVANPLAAGVTQISNTATIAYDNASGADTNPADNTASDTTPVTGAPDLSISKSDGGASVAPGGTVSYTLTYSNTGNRGASGVTLTETVPANTAFNAGASTAGWSCAPNNNAGSTCTLSIGTVAASAGGSATFAVTVSNPLPAGVSQISNTATIGDDGTNGTDPTPGNNGGSDTTPVTGAPDLSISKSDGGASVSPGGTVSYTLTYSNTGNRGASGVTLTETVPANTTFNAGASTAGWSCAPNNNAGSTCTLSIGTVAAAAGGSATFAVTVDNPLGGGVTQISNTATIADDGANGTDPTPGNNSGSDTTPVTGAPDLSISKSDGGASIAPGGTVAYTLTYSNTGSRGATGVVLTETVPANTTFNAGASTAGWTCVPNNNAGSTCTLAVGAVAASGGGNETFSVTASNPLPAGVTQISNTASISDDGTNGTDPTPGNNSSSDATPVTGAPDLSISKSDGGASVAPGGTVSYTLTYSNTGNRGASGVTLTETVPANTAFNAGASTAGWSCAPNNNAGSTCTLSIGTVAASAGGSATFAVTVSNPLPAGVSQISNTATIGDDGTNGTDPTPGNNGGSDTTPVTGAPDLSISKSDGGASVAAGGTVSYTLTYNNTGNRGASGVTITETVPANTTFNAGASTAGWSCAPNNSPGSTCTLSIGTVAAAGGGSATFAVTVDSPLGGGVTEISNTATIADDGANGTDPTPSNNSGSDTTPISIATIDAVNDDFTGTPINGFTGGTTATVFTNDTLNGASFLAAAVNVTLTNNGGVAGASIASNGTISIPAGTAAAAYTLTYQICEVANPSNCDSATAKVLINPPVIDAVNDDFSGTPINGFTGGTTATVFTNDTLNGASFANAAVNVTLTNNGTVTGASIASDGTISIPAGTKAGTYTLTYQICEVLNPANCDSATAKVLINPPVIDAVNDDFTGAPMNVASGGSTATVFTNDTLNGSPFANAAVNVTLTNDGGVTGAAIGSNGTISIPAGTAAGPYTLTYQICEVLNPTNCDSATAKVLLNNASIDAVNDDFTGTPIAGTTGGTTVTVFTNDTLNGSPFGNQAVNVTLTNNGGVTGATISPDGTISIPAGTPGNTYTLTYQICEAANPSNCDSATVMVLVTPTADISVVKTLVTPPAYAVGQTISYTLVVANAGPNTATNIQVTDTPTNLTITNVSGSGCAALPCTIASLAVGANTTINVTATINAAGAFDNASTVTATESDPNPSNNTDNTGNNGNAAASADVSVVKTLVTGAPYTMGQSISYTLVVANAGPSIATSIQVTDAPTNLTITNVSGSGCAALPCTIASLAVGANTTINVTATINTAGAFDNSATVAAAETDPNLANNTDNTGNNGSTGAAADVSVVKTLTTAGPFNAGQSVTYTLVVANAGPNAATNIQVTDTPTNLTITNVSGSGCAALPCTIASLAVGANTTITVTATITASGVFDNSTTVTATEFDPNPSNNTDNTNNGGSTGPSADVSVVKTLLTAAPFSAGQTVSYTLLVANAGPSPATNIQVTDTPTNLTITGVAGGGCSALPCTIANLAVGANVTITVTATINAAGAFDNATTVTATEFDPNTSNNTDNTGNGGSTSATVDLMVTKTASVQQLHVGETFNYSIVVHNNGPSTATGVVMTDPLPANFQLQSSSSTQGACTGTTTVTCSIGTMLNGATVTITISGRVTGAGSLSNTATVTANESETVTSNNTSVATPAVISAAGVPTLGEYGLMFMAVMLAIAGAIVMRGRL